MYSLLSLQIKECLFVNSFIEKIDQQKIEGMLKKRIQNRKQYSEPGKGTSSK
jgi:hypothetical protein